MAVPAVHVITPGDHFSPSTGSAVPTVVHGLASATPLGAPRTRVAVARGTYEDRYPSADVLEYDQVRLRRLDRHTDAAAARLGLSRRGARRVLAATLTGQETWPASVVIGHNMPQLVPLVDTARHAPVLYVHNELLRTYSTREAARVLDPAGAIVCVSRYIAERTASRLPVRLRDRVTVVGNGVDATLFRPDERVADETVEVVFVGRMLREKAPDVLIDALVRLNRPDIHVTLVGTVNFAPDAPLSEYERELRRAAAPLGDRVTWLPFKARADVAEILRSADVAVVPSRWPDPCPLTVLEGMASGAAMVAARSGGIPDIVADAGILVSPGDADALAQALDALATDRGLLARQRSAARVHAVAHDWAWARSTLDRELGRLGIDVAPPALAQDE
ncbi:glycosyltransferase family 4 protein [Xylanimonas protaetiae]|uniref:D-inositol 3-phosphate glycosyltransferase n=1 Tax=Xylanimonas protaetiae TaxID=2509457 RepID=A0A4P6F2Q7_9MICO|nr:glycosyltransferase family 4 protein [Xylanimonas protaetiae]QAY69013.1 glycosyltransferase [Xylanimonas protaetiae]